MDNAIVRLKKELSKAIIGQERFIDAIIVSLLCEGNLLVEGVPGLAKTTTIKALSKAIDLSFSRIQFTPDLLPSDITGTQIYNPKTQAFSIKKGPIFAHLVLADEINRAPAKVQSALLEAMEEKQVTIAQETFPLPSPFFVMATQNPLEHEGIYPLPEAQLDRFMLKISLQHPSDDEAFTIMRKAASKSFDAIEAIWNRKTLETLRNAALSIHIDEALERYIVALVSATRTPSRLDFEAGNIPIRYGAGPRGMIDLLKASKAYALLKGKTYVDPSDIAAMAPLVLSHRIGLHYEASLQGYTPGDYIADIIASLPVP